MSTLTITTVQSNLYWQDKAANLKMLEDKIYSIGEKTELVVLPEMFSTGFVIQPQELAETMEGETVQWMKRVAAKKKVIITGSIIIRVQAAESVPTPGTPRYTTTGLYGCFRMANTVFMIKGIDSLLPEKMKITQPVQRG